MSEEALAVKIEQGGLDLSEDLSKQAANSILETASNDLKGELLDIINNATESQIAEFLTEQGAKQGDISKLVENMTSKDALFNTLSKGSGAIAEAAGEMTTAAAKDALSGASKISDLKGAADTAIAKAGGDSAIWAWIKENPKFALLGMGATAVGIYLAVEAAMGVSPADALGKLASLVGDAAKEVAGFTGGLANSFAQGLFGNFWPYIEWGLVIVGIIIVLYILWKLYGMFKGSGNSEQYIEHQA